MLTTDELNKIIKKFKNIRELELPYCKGMIYRNEAIKILKEFTNYETTNEGQSKGDTDTLGLESE